MAGDFCFFFIFPSNPNVKEAEASCHDFRLPVMETLASRPSALDAADGLQKKVFWWSFWTECRADQEPSSFNTKNTQTIPFQQKTCHTFPTLRVC